MFLPKLSRPAAVMCRQITPMFAAALLFALLPAQASVATADTPAPAATDTPARAEPPSSSTGLPATPQIQQSAPDARGSTGQPAAAPSPGADQQPAPAAPATSASTPAAATAGTPAPAKTPPASVDAPAPATPQPRPEAPETAKPAELPAAPSASVDQQPVPKSPSAAPADTPSPAKTPPASVEPPAPATPQPRQEAPETAKPAERPVEAPSASADQQPSSQTQAATAGTPAPAKTPPASVDQQPAPADAPAPAVPPAASMPGKLKTVIDYMQQEASLDLLKPVTTEKTFKKLKMAGSAVELTGTLASISGDLEKELEAAREEGRKVSLANMAGNVLMGTAKGAALDAASKKAPLIGQIVEIATMPRDLAVTYNRNMVETRNEYYDKYGPGHDFAASMHASWKTFKDMTPVGTADRIIDEVAKEEYERVAEGGDPSYVRYFGTITTRTLGEVSQFNSLARFSTETFYGVHNAQVDAAKAEQRFRRTAEARAAVNLSETTALRREIQRLDMAYGRDDPAAAQRIGILENIYKEKFDGVRQVGQRLREYADGQDAESTGLYKRLKAEEILSKAERLKDELTIIAATQDTTDSFAYNRILNRRELLREQVEALRTLTKDTVELTGMDNLGSTDLREQLRDARDFMAKVDAIEAGKPASGFELPARLEKAAERMNRPDVWATPDDKGANEQRFAEQQRREAILEEMKRKEAAGELPPGVSAQDAFEAAILEEFEKSKADAAAEAGEAPATDAAPESTEAAAALADATAGEAEEIIEEEPVPEPEAEEPDPSFIPAQAMLTVEGGDLPLETVPGIEVEKTVPYEGAPKIRKNAAGVLIEQKGERNGKSHGLHISCRNDGTKTSATSYKDGARHGPSRSWSATGVLTSEAWYRAGKEHGPVRSFNSDGSRKSEKWFRDGVSHGPQREWTQEGVLTLSAVNENNQRVLEQTWQRDGTPIARKQHVYAEGRQLRHGLQQVWFGSGPHKGKLSSVERFDRGIPHGLSRRWDNNRQLVQEVRHEQGALRWRKLYSGGLPSSESSWTGEPKNEKAHGLHREWITYGPAAAKLKRELRFTDGTPHGMHREWSEQTGEPSLEGTWINGLRCGTWRWWDQKTGAPTMTLRLSNGIPEGDQDLLVNGVPARHVRISNGTVVLVEFFAPDGKTLLYKAEGRLAPPCSSLPAPAKATLETLSTAGYSIVNNPQDGSTWPCGRLQLIDGWERIYFTKGPGAGLPSAETRREGGLLHGTQTEWLETGILKSRQNYAQDRRDGLSEWFFADGTIAKRIEFKEGLRHGLYESFFSDGMPSQKASFANGLGEGPLQTWFYFKHEQMSTEGTLSRGYRTGWWREFDASGGLSETGHHKPWKEDLPVPEDDPAFGLTLGVMCPHGPQVRFKGGKAFDISYGRALPDSSPTQAEYTRDPQVYHKWRAQDATLPASIPGGPPVPPPGARDTTVSIPGLDN